MLHYDLFVLDLTVYSPNNVLGLELDTQQRNSNQQKSRVVFQGRKYSRRNKSLSDGGVTG